MLQTVNEVGILCFCVHVFRTDYLGSDNLTGSLFMEKTEYPSLNTYILPISLHLWVESFEILLIHAGMLSGITLVLSLSRQPYS